MSSAGKEKSKIYEAVFISPGMNEKSKIVLHLSRQSILLLSRLIEAGLSGNKESADEWLSLLPGEAKQELETVVPELLKKGGLTDFYEKLKQL
jgi:hypothetical protein